MEKINTDYKRQNWKNAAQAFQHLQIKRWRSPFNHKWYPYKIIENDLFVLDFNIMCLESNSRWSWDSYHSTDTTGSISVFGQLRNCPSPNATLTYYLSKHVGLGVG